MAVRWIDMKYKCGCIGSERTVMLMARGVGEDIERFMHRATVALSDDHRRRSPTCRAAKMEYVKIPFEGETVGGGTGGTA